LVVFVNDEQILGGFQKYTSKNLNGDLQQRSKKHMEQTHFRLRVHAVILQASSQPVWRDWPGWNRKGSRAGPMGKAHGQGPWAGDGTAVGLTGLVTQSSVERALVITYVLKDGFDFHGIGAPR